MMAGSLPKKHQPQKRGGSRVPCRRFFGRDVLGVRCPAKTLKVPLRAQRGQPTDRTVLPVSHRA